MKNIIRIVIAFAFFWLLAFAHVRVISVPYPAVNDFVFWEKGGKFFDLFMTAVSFGALTSIIFCIKALFFSRNNKKYLLPLCAACFPIILGYLGAVLPDQIYTVLQYIYLGIFGVCGIFPTLFYGVFTFAGMGGTVTLVITLIVALVCGIWAREIFRAFFKKSADTSRKSLSGGSSQEKSQSSGASQESGSPEFRKNLKAANKGDAEAQYTVGMMYYDGDQIEQNYSEAVKYLQSAAEQNYPETLYMMGECYSREKGVTWDIKKALEYYQKAAEYEETAPKTHYTVGNIYRCGTGVDKDYERAVKHYRLSAEAGNSAAQLALAVCYQTGDGVEMDVNESFAYLMTSAENGNEDAIKYCEIVDRMAKGDTFTIEDAVSIFENVGIIFPEVLYIVGQYCISKENYKVAAKLLDFAAAIGGGYADAQYSLAKLYTLGIGVEQDGNLAFILYKKAAAQGHKEAQKMIDYINEMQTESE